MAPKRSNALKMSVVKKVRRVINLETKLDIIKRSERGFSGAAIARALGLRDSTVRTILKNRDRFKLISKEKSSYRSSFSSHNAQTAIVKRPIMSKYVSSEIDNQLIAWYSKEAQIGNIIDYEEFKAKALSIYIETTKDISNTGLFTARKELFEFCKRRFSSVSDTSSEAASADAEDINSVATNFCEVVNNNSSYNMQSLNAFSQNFQEIIEEGGYSLSQIFTVSKTHLFWKRVPVKEVNEKISLADSIDHVTLLLGCNAVGDFKLKPLLVNLIENPKTLRGYPKDKLPVMWKANRKGALTQLIFSDWFTSYFCPAVEQYCYKNNLENKALLLVDSSPEYPTSLDDLSTNVKVIFLPPNASNILSLVDDESFIKVFKANYQYKIFSQILTESENTESHDINFYELWKSYDMQKAIYNIIEAWNEIKPSTMNKMWRQLIPSYIMDYLGFVDETENVYENMVETAKRLHLQNLSRNYFQEELSFSIDKLSNEHWTQLLNQKQLEAEEEDDDIIQIKCLSANKLGEAIKHLESAMTIFKEHDPDSERSFNVCYTIKNAIASYRQLYRDKKKLTDISLSWPFRNVQGNTESSEYSTSSEIQSTNSNEPQPSNIPIDIKLEFSPAGSPSSTT